MLNTCIRMPAVAATLMGVLIAYGQSKTPAPRFQVAEATIDGIHTAMTSGKLTARELVQAYFERIVAFDKQGPALNCIINLNPHALEDADRLDAAFRCS